MPNRNQPETRMVSERLKTKRLDDGSRKLLKGIEVCVEPDVANCKSKKRTIKVPSGFVTDYSSIPWFGRWLIRWSKVDIAGVVHDYLYSCKSEEKYGCVTRSQADEVWYLIARSGSSRKSRANWLQAKICWMVLRAVSWIFWRAETSPDFSSL